MIKAIGKLFTGILAAITGIFSRVGDMLLDLNSVSHAENELERARRNQDADKVALAKLAVRKDELVDNDLRDARTHHQAAVTAYRRALANVKGDGEGKQAAVSALRYMRACADKIKVIETYISTIETTYNKGIETLRQRENNLQVATYELDTLKIRKEMDARQTRLVGFGSVDEAIRNVRKLIREYDALGAVKTETEAPVAVEQAVVQPVVDDELMAQVEKDLDELTHASVKETGHDA
jgi:hypothetical protein